MEKVYCKQCRFFKKGPFEFEPGTEKVLRCEHPELLKFEDNPVYARRVMGDCLKQNAKNACSKYKGHQ